jgi:predicted short-subunit dehydrogenase-like oxidoreductase (DUF2520 family)
MRVGIIGAGRVGCAIAIALKEKGHTISGIYSRSADSASYLNNVLELTLSNELIETVINSEVIFITTSDKVISDIADRITCQIGNLDITCKTFFHCSGALNSEEMKTLNQVGASVGSLHPIQTFANKENGWKGLNDIYFGFEGSDIAKLFAEEIVKALNSRMLIIDKDSKVLYHTAACILSNYMATLSFMAEGLFEKIGLNSEIGLKAFMPLMEKTLSNIKENGSLSALTGPVSRGDYTVVERHLRELDEKNPDLSDAYKILGIKTVEAAFKKGTLDNESIRKLNQLFKAR